MACFILCPYSCWHTEGSVLVTVGNQFACRDRLRVTELWSVWSVLYRVHRVLQHRSDSDLLPKLDQAVAAHRCQWRNLTSPVNELQTTFDGWRLQWRDTAQLSAFVRRMPKKDRKTKELSNIKCIKGENKWNGNRRTKRGNKGNVK